MRKVLLLSFSAALMLGVASAQTTTDDRPSLADLAAKQKKAKTPKKVITNEDLPEHPADSAQGSSNGSIGSGASTTAAVNTPDAKPDGTKAAAKDKKAPDPDAVAAAQTKIDGLKHDEEVYTNGIKKSEDMMASGDDFRRNMMAEALQHQKENLEATKAKRQAAESELDKLKNPPK